MLQMTEIEANKEVLESKGWLFLDGLDDPFKYVQNFGKLIPQYDGEIIWQVKAKDEFDTTYHSMNNKELSMHTECYEFKGIPPKHLALWCIDPGNPNEGFTYLSDLSSQIFKYFSSENREEFEKDAINFSSTPGLSKEGFIHEETNPLVSWKNNKELILRYSERCMDYGNSSENFKHIISCIKKEIELNKITISWRRGCLLIWNNHRFSHSRSSFSNKNRELKRVWLT